ncbi:hypothetical protein, partial [Klebsiella pneumoniae]|uniref:hypothetical protein n=1 Tax=Klebsiella pneumoniae TaxID=573 RepID=UPI003B507447
AYGPQNDVTLKMPAFEWVHVQLHQQKGMISLSPPTICNSADPFSGKTFVYGLRSDFRCVVVGKRCSEAGKRCVKTG